MDFLAKNGDLAKLYAQVSKKPLKKEEKASKNKEKLQEITKKSEKQRKMKHFCRKREESSQ